MTRRQYLATGLCDLVTREIEALLIEADQRDGNSTSPKTFAKGRR